MYPIAQIQQVAGIQSLKLLIDLQSRNLSAIGIFLVQGIESLWGYDRSCSNPGDLGPQVVDLFAGKAGIALDVCLEIAGEVFVDLSGYWELLGAGLRQPGPNSTGYLV